MKINKRNAAVAVVLGLLVGFVVYKAKQPDPVTVYPKPGTTLEQVGTNYPLITNTVEVKNEIIDLPPVVIVGRTDTPPFRHGTKLCQWYEDAGMRSVSDMDGWAESVCSGDTCFLLVHDAGVPAGWIMVAWVSEARSKGHDPRKENIELSVFTFQGGEETDHIAYFPGRDVFESY